MIDFIKRDMFTDWCDTLLIIKQGDTLPPTLYALCGNDLALQINGGCTVYAWIILHWLSFYMWIYYFTC